MPSDRSGTVHPQQLAAAQQALSGPATDFVEHTEHDRGHGRAPQRILRPVGVAADTSIDFSNAAQLFLAIRYVGDLDGHRRTKEVAYRVTSLTPARAGAPDVGELLRGQAMAIRNTLIAALRLTGWTNLKQACRHFSHGTDRCVDLIAKSLKTVKRQT
ncbi:MAG: hypothetical protein ACRDTH_15775 [Pseudonocardiaceae bacterium]